MWCTRKRHKIVGNSRRLESSDLSKNLLQVIKSKDFKTLSNNPDEAVEKFDEY